MSPKKLLTLTLLTLLASAASAEDWPQWLGPNSDGISRETGLLEQWPPAGPPLLWSAKVGIGYATPVVAKNKIYAFTLLDGQETLTALDASSGKILYQKKFHAGRPDNYPGTRATPTIDGNRIFLLGANGDLTAANLADGKTLWTLNILKETNAQNIGWGTSSSPLLYQNKVIVQGGKNGPVALALDKNSGKILWTADHNGTSSYAAPIAIESNSLKQIVIFAADGARALDPDSGKTLWAVPFKTGPDVNAATPVFRDNRLFLSGEYGHGCLLVNVDGHTAQRAWPKDKKHVMAKFQPPILDRDALYVNSSGTLKCLSWPDIQEKWTSSDFKLGQGGSLLRNADKLILLGDSGTLSLAHATPEKCQKISQFQPFPNENELWASPVISNAKLYVKGQDTLKCYNIKK